MDEFLAMLRGGGASPFAPPGASLYRSAPDQAAGLGDAGKFAVNTIPSGADVLGEKRRQMAIQQISGALDQPAAAPQAQPQPAGAPQIMPAAMQHFSPPQQAPIGQPMQSFPMAAPRQPSRGGGMMGLGQQFLPVGVGGWGG